jgi:hypothetical protein
MKPLYLQYERRNLDNNELFSFWFSGPLHMRGSDFTIDRYQWEACTSSEQFKFFEAGDWIVLSVLVERLMKDDTFVTQLTARTFELELVLSREVSAEYIVEIVVRELQTTGFEVIESPRMPKRQPEPVAIRWSKIYQPSDWLFFQDELARAFHWLGSTLKRAWGRLFARS